MSSTSALPDDFGNTAAEATRLVLGQPLNGRTDYEWDIDAFKLAVQVGWVYKVNIAGGFTGGVQTSDVYDLSSDFGIDLNNRSQTFRAPQTGDIDLQLWGNRPLDYTLTVSVVSMDDHPDVPAGASALAVGGTVSGQIETPADVDTFRLTVEAGKSYVLQGRGALVGDLVVDTSYGFLYHMDLRAGSYKFMADTSGEMIVEVKTRLATGAYSLAASSTVHDDFSGQLDGSRYEGGSGFDTIRFGSLMADYNVARSGDGFIISSPLSTQSSVLTGIERIFSADGHARALDIDGVGGAAYRLYQAAFDRAPDQAGIGFWIAAMDRGISLHDVAAGFMASAEFTARYGASSSNTDFVALLYQNVLNRPGEQAGMDYWIGALDRGYQRADVLANFSEGAENAANVASLIGNGFEYIPYGG